MNQSTGQIAIYQTDDGSITTEVRLEGETVWLSQKQMAELFDKNIMTINEHIANVFAEGELEPSSTIREFLIVRQEGKREVKREIEHYNLDAIISVGYRVKSKQGTQSASGQPSVCASIWCRATALTSSGWRRNRRNWPNSNRR